MVKKTYSVKFRGAFEYEGTDATCIPFMFFLPPSCDASQFTFLNDEGGQIDVKNDPVLRDQVVTVRPRRRASTGERREQ